MSDEFTFKLDYPLTQEQIDVITDAELEHTSKIWFTTRSGKEVEFAKTPQWIPCEDRLPSEDAYYLVTLGNGIAEDGQDIEMCAWADGHWDWWNSDLVIAWMPLPEPWKGELNDTLH